MTEKRANFGSSAKFEIEVLVRDKAGNVKSREVGILKEGQNGDIS